MRKAAALITGGTLAIGLMAMVPATGAEAATTFQNCTQLNKTYPHGVGKKGAVDKTSSKKVRNFKVNDKVYKKYSTSASRGGVRDLDRDNDGIACEKR